MSSSSEKGASLDPSRRHKLIKVRELCCLFRLCTCVTCSALTCLHHTLHSNSADPCSKTIFFFAK